MPHESPVPRDLGAAPSTPRWVKVSGAAVVILVVAFVILHLAGGGFRHDGMPIGAATDQAQPPGAHEHGSTQHSP